MSSEGFLEDIGGQRASDWCSRYPEPASRECPDCHSPSGAACTFVAEYPSRAGVKTERRARHSPCLARLKAEAP